MSEDLELGVSHKEVPEKKKKSKKSSSDGKKSTSKSKKTSKSGTKKGSTSSKKRVKQPPKNVIRTRLQVLIAIISLAVAIGVFFSNVHPLLLPPSGSWHKTTCTVQKAEEISGKSCVSTVRGEDICSGPDGTRGVANVAYLNEFEEIRYAQAYDRLDGGYTTDSKAEFLTYFYTGRVVDCYVEVDIQGNWANAYRAYLPWLPHKFYTSLYVSIAFAAFSGLMIMLAVFPCLPKLNFLPYLWRFFSLGDEKEVAKIRAPRNPDDEPSVLLPENKKVLNDTVGAAKVTVDEVPPVATADAEEVSSPKVTKTKKSKQPKIEVEVEVEEVGSPKVVSP